LLYIFSGPDDFSIAQELENIKKQSGDPSVLATNTVVLEGKQVGLNEFQSACETVPFLADKRLVIIHGLLERFASKERPARSGAKSAGTPVAMETFGEIMNRLPESTVLVLVESDLKTGNPLLKMVAAKARTKNFPLLNAAELRNWINERVAHEGGSISPGAVNLLARLIGSNLWFMSSEIGKLVLYTDGRPIEEKDVQTLVSYNQQTSVFSMVDAIVEFNLQKAESTMQQLLKEGATPTSLLAMLNRQMRLIVRIRELKAQKLTQAEMGGRLVISHEFIVRKTLEQAGRYTLPRLKEVYEKMLDTDLAIKTGHYDGELALNILVTELCQQHSRSHKAAVAS